jgi:hypothetical protein
MIVTAKYDGKKDEARENRIHKVFDRCGVRLAVFDPDIELAPGQFQVGFSDVDWASYGDGDDEETRLRIHVEDEEHDRAERLASELRCCGMVVGIGSDDVEDDLDYYDDEDED